MLRISAIVLCFIQLAGVVVILTFDHQPSEVIEWLAVSIFILTPIICLIYLWLPVSSAGLISLYLKRKASEEEKRIRELQRMTDISA